MSFATKVREEPSFFYFVRIRARTHVEARRMGFFLSEGKARVGVVLVHEIFGPNDYPHASVQLPNTTPTAAQKGLQNGRIAR